MARLIVSFVFALFWAVSALAWSPGDEKWVGIDGAAGVAHGLLIALTADDPYYEAYWASHPDVRDRVEATMWQGLAWARTQTTELDGMLIWNFYQGGPPITPANAQGVPLILKDMYAYRPYPGIRDAVVKTINYTRWLKKDVRAFPQPCARWPLYAGESMNGGNYAHGVGSVVDTLLAANAITGEAEYETMAIAGANWLCHVAQSDERTYDYDGVSDQGAYWFATYTYDQEGHVVDHSQARCGICIGAAGNVRLLLQLYERYKDAEQPVGEISARKLRRLAQRYREYAERGLNWLTTMGVEDLGGKKWPAYADDEVWYVAWYGKGTSGIAATFAEAYRITGCPEYADNAMAGMRWLRASAIEGAYVFEGDTHPTYHWRGYQGQIKVSQCQGVDSVGVACLEVADVGLDSTIPDNRLAPYVDELQALARGAAWYVASHAVADRGGHTWQFIRPLEGDDIPLYATGFYTCGAAGTIDTMRKLGTALDEPHFKDLSLGAARWLCAVAKPGEVGVRWPSNVIRLESCNLTPATCD